jgi:hypothetical protein
MKLGKDDLLAALRLRYDHYSAQTIFDASRKQAGLADQPSYAGAEVAALRAALDAIGDRLERVNERLDGMLGDSEPAKPEVIAKQDPKPEPVIEKPEPVIANPEPVSAKPEHKPEPKPEPVIVKPEPMIAKPEPKPEPVSAKPEPKPEPVIAKPEPATAAIATRIVLSGISVADGEHVLVCGELAELGNWDPERARPMSRDGDNWSATVELVPGTKGSFKFLRRSTDGTVQWEAGEDRDLIPVPRLDVTWQS